MTMLPYRGSIAWAAVMAAFFSTIPAAAQVIVVPSPKQPKGPGHPLITGVLYDEVNQEKAEQRLQHLQSKLGSDAERCDSAALERHNRRIAELRYRIVVDEWLIRKNSLQDPGCYPLRIDTLSVAAITQAASPPPAPIFTSPVVMPGPTVVAPTIPVTIINAGSTGAGVSFAVDGTSHQVATGSRLDLSVAPDSSVTFDGGGLLGPRRYRLTSGQYEFRSTAQGWELYKLPSTP